ncbi:hypothetical protein M3Y96_00534300 [Aphelenchoides besseyi]|nr:hypothetical protein M3Y96_00534300 [Aphelenchoides besseyi]
MFTLLFLFGFFGLVSCTEPCKGQIVIVLDSAEESSWLPKELFINQKNFVKKLFADLNFDDYERLVIGSYNQNTYLTNFGDFKNESDVNKYVDAIEQENALDWLGNGLNDVMNQKYTFYRNTTVIFFVSACIACGDGEYTRENAKSLQDQGVRLVLVAHGDPEHISVRELAAVTNDISTVFNWDPRLTMPANDYRAWFKQVLACPIRKPVVNSCGRQILVLLDTTADSEAFTMSDFDAQNNLINNLFTDSNFIEFERLAIGFYSNKANLTEFGDFYEQSDVSDFVNSIEPDYDNALYLPKVLKAIYEHHYSWSINSTIIVFLSDVETAEVEPARRYAKAIQDFGIRLVLVGHGDFEDDYVSVDRLVEITGDPDVVFKWDPDTGLPKDYVGWFNQVLGCLP